MYPIESKPLNCMKCLCKRRKTFDLSRLSYRSLSNDVDNLIRRSRAMSESRITDPYYDFLSDLTYWPTYTERAFTPIRAR